MKIIEKNDIAYKNLVILRINKHRQHINTVKTLL